MEGTWKKTKNHIHKKNHVSLGWLPRKLSKKEIKCIVEDNDDNSLPLDLEASIEAFIAQALFTCIYGDVSFVSLCLFCF